MKFCGPTGFGVPITISLSNIFHIARFETEAFYFTYNYAINE